MRLGGGGETPHETGGCGHPGSLWVHLTPQGSERWGAPSELGGGCCTGSFGFPVPWHSEREEGDPAGLFGGPSFKGWWLGGFPWVVGQWVGCEMGSGGYTCLCWVSPVSLGLFHKTGGGVYADSWSPSPVARKRRPCCLYRLGGCGVPQGRWWCVAIRPRHFAPPPVGGGMPTEDGGGGLAASLWDSLPFANGAGPARTAVVLTPPRCGLPLIFANGMGPARTAVVLAPPLLAYGWCGWASLGMCRQ